MVLLRLPYKLLLSPVLGVVYFASDRETGAW
jgi:hypothetical protein